MSIDGELMGLASWKEMFIFGTEARFLAGTAAVVVFGRVLGGPFSLSSRVGEIGD
jgi:hypothetical protein